MASVVLIAGFLQSVWWMIHRYASSYSMLLCSGIVDRSHWLSVETVMCQEEMNLWILSEGERRLRVQNSFQGCEIYRNEITIQCPLRVVMEAELCGIWQQSRVAVTLTFPAVTRCQRSCGHWCEVVHCAWIHWFSSCIVVRILMRKLLWCGVDVVILDITPYSNIHYVALRRYNFLLARAKS